MRQDDAEPVAAKPPDQVADPQATVEPAADFDQNGVGHLIAEQIVDHGHAVDADRQKSRRIGRALIGGDDLIDRLAQAALVEMAGQLVVVGELLETALLRLAVADCANHPEHTLRPSGVVALRAPALMDPGEDAAGAAHPVFAIEAGSAIEMVGEHQLPVHQIVGMDPAGKPAPGRQLGGKFAPRVGQSSGPIEPIAVEVPGIGDIACRFECGDRAARWLFVPCEHWHQPWLVTRPTRRETPTRGTDRCHPRPEYVEELLNAMLFGFALPAAAGLSSAYATPKTAEPPG